MAETTSANLAALLLLADGRMPVGAHANSGGAEWAARWDNLDDIATLERWVLGRLHSTGRVDAAFSVAASSLAAGEADEMERFGVLDVEYGSRMIATRARSVSRQLGRQFLRAAIRVWPQISTRPTNPDGFYAPIALGLVAGALGIGHTEVATISVHHTIAAGCTAAIRLLGLDPLEVTAMQARLGSTVEQLANSSEHWATCEASLLPATTSPLADILAQDHGEWSQRLFVA